MVRSTLHSSQVSCTPDLQLLTEMIAGDDEATRRNRQALGIKAIGEGRDALAIPGERPHLDGVRLAAAHDHRAVEAQAVEPRATG